MKERISKNEWKGCLAVAKVDLRAVEKGIISSDPQTPCRYDRVLDIGGDLKRVQIKYAGQSSWNSGGVAISKIEKVMNRIGTKKGYSQTEIDAILLYVPQVDKICWFDPIDFEGKIELRVRYKPSKNGQTKGCTMLEDKEW